MRILFICILSLMTNLSFAKVVNLYGTLPEGAKIDFERVYSAKRKLPFCGRWEHWGLGIPEWVGKIKSERGEAQITGTEFKLAINFDLDDNFCRYYSRYIYLRISIRQPNGKLIEAGRLTITTLDDYGNDAIPPLQSQYNIKCVSGNWGGIDETGSTRKVRCAKTNDNYLWGIFNINEARYNEQPIRIDITSEFIN